MKAAQWNEPADLASVVITHELADRPRRAPDFESENLALVMLAQHLSDAPEDILQNLAEATLALCRADSAGISILEDGNTIFRWHALTGALAGHRWATTPRNFSPCGTVLDRNCTLLMAYPEHHFRYFADVRPVIVEALLVPFEVDGKVIGTIWAVSHDAGLKFDGEDSRIIANLAKFASACYQVRASVEAVRQADRNKDEFLAMLGHELRNPLFPLQNALHYLIKGSADATGMDQAKGVIQRQLAHMNRLIDDLLDASRISTGKIELRKQRIELAQVVQNATDTSRAGIEAAGHSLEVSLPQHPVYLEADPDRLAQIFANLLTNAAKYTKPGGEIKVLAHVDGSEVQIRVHDNGIGIAADKLESIFEMFSQVDASAERSHGGLGIGLALVRTLVKGHGGSVAAHSAGRDQGSAFVVSLPIAAAREGIRDGETGAAAEGKAAPVPSLRILIADDNRDAADSLAMVLRLSGHEVWSVYDGPSALETAVRHRPQVVLNDIALPGMNGYEVARRLRENPQTRSSLLVAVTGYATSADQDRSRAAGFDHHMTKPVDLGSLHRLLSSVAE